MPPIMTEEQKYLSDSEKLQPAGGYNNNEVLRGDDQVDSMYPIPPAEIELRYPADRDIVHFLPWSNQQNMGRNALQITKKAAVGLPSNLKGYSVDFKGYAYDKNKSLASEIQFRKISQTRNNQVQLMMHDPTKSDKYSFPYQLCIYQKDDKVILLAVNTDKIKVNEIEGLSAFFCIQPVSWGSSSFLFMINQQFNKEYARTPFYLARSPDNYAMYLRSDRYPSLTNPMALMFMTDEGPSDR
ncbi:uncharacterized protein [Antedon mediterranea]|uniref:uncharacterized protein n=1 Tax=Antedon mediterranea TaxID=105859 RepID=UPI003AF79C1C